jgi:predicted O-methyltransferase YrrM
VFFFIFHQAQLNCGGGKAMKHGNNYMDTFEEYRLYIESLYRSKTVLQRDNFISQTGWKEFIPLVDDDAARFLQLILQLKRPLKILEIGTSLGFSTTSMALAAQQYGGSIITIEFDADVAEQAQKNFRQTGVDDTIQLLRSDALQIVPNFPDAYFDMIFQDVDKRLYPVLLDDCVRILKSGGVLVGDDALFPVMALDEKWKDQIAPMREFNELVAASPQLDSMLLPVGDGMMVAVKR